MNRILFIGQAVPATGDGWRLVEHGALVLTTIAALFGLFIAWRTFLRKRERRKIEPDPLRIRKVEPNAKEKNCLDRYDRVLKLLEQEQRANKEVHERIYDQIDEVEKRHADKLQEAVKDVNETIRTLPKDVIDLLRSTGQLKQHHD